MTKINIKTKGTEVSVKTDFDANDIVKLITGIEQQQNIPNSINAIELSSLFQEDKPFKSKAIIKKVNPHTIDVDGTRLSLNNLPKTNEFKKAGTDYYVLKDADDKYTIAQADAEEFDEYLVIGGFHYGLIPEDFQPRNNITQKQAKKIRGINAYSIWDKKHRPLCDPSGMVYIPKLKIWVDIYLTNSEHKEYGTSRAGKHIAAGSNNNGRKIPDGLKDLKGADIDAIANAHRKRLLTKDEFQVAMDGVKENVSARELDDGTTKHIPDFVSKYGIEQATGVQWVWSSTPYGEESEDDDRFILGGHRGDGANAGSRASHWNICVWYSYWFFGSRFACDNLKLEK
jgi:hypothetical protein